MLLSRRSVVGYAGFLFVGIVAACSSSSSTTGGDSANGGPDNVGDGGTKPLGDGGGKADSGPPMACKTGKDCTSGVCSAKLTCLDPTAMDGVKNGTETDIDCGGTAPSNALACADGKACKVGADCKDLVCADLMDGKGLRCQPPSSTDGVKNGNETGVDCGGMGNPQCANGQGCVDRTDCSSGVCLKPEGGAGLLCTAPTPADGILDGTETDVDCGGASAPACADALKCLVAGDCTSKVCKNTGMGLRCQPATSSDGVVNGTETDVDCGGGAPTNAPACVAGKKCLAGTDCKSTGCNYAGKCTITKSCVPHYGGDTCGQGEFGAMGSANEECCATAPVTADKGTVNLGKYQVTSGRMRQFVTSVKGDVRTFVQSARAKGQLNGATMDPAWDLYLPSSFIGCEQDGSCLANDVTDYSMFEDATGLHPDLPAYQGLYTSVYRYLGGTVFHGQGTLLQGCRLDAPGTHTYWMDKTTQANYFGDVPAEFDQTTYDQKALNCVPYLMAQAFCIWDGGRLETFPEWQAAWGPGAYPWGASPAPKQQISATFNAYRYPTATDAILRSHLGDPAYKQGLIPGASESIEYADYTYSYEYPSQISYDYMVFINSPGRLKGRGPAGHADVLGPMMEVTSTMQSLNAVPYNASAWWTANGSWEGHGYSKSVIWTGFSLTNKYGKQGLRCAYPTLP
jgi:hypothetical protein